MRFKGAPLNRSLRRAISLSAATLGLIACQKPDQRAFLPYDASDCRPDVYLLGLPRGGGFTLNDEQRDSAQVAKWIREVLPKRDSSVRIVFIRADSSRKKEIPWLLPAITSVRARVYADDGSCKTAVQMPR